MCDHTLKDLGKENRNLPIFQNKLPNTSQILSQLIPKIKKAGNTIHYLPFLYHTDFRNGFLDHKNI